MVNLKHILIALGILLLLFGAGFLTGRKTARNGQISPDKPEPDTTTVTSTIVDDSPKEEAAIPKGWELVPTARIREYEEVIAAYKDSLARKPLIVTGVPGVTAPNSQFIAVPISQSTFTDHQTYECIVEGYATKMLWHKSFQETKYVQVPTLQQPKWQFSPVVSGFVGKDLLAVGGGLKLDIWSKRWQFTPSINYCWGYNGGQQWHGVVGSFSLSYNLIRK